MGFRSRLFFVAIFCLAVCASVATARTPDKWTFMVYMNADCDLEEAAIDDFLEMASAPSTDTVNVVVLLDRHSDYDDRYGDWTEARRGLVQHGDTPTEAWGESMGEINMGSDQTLRNFVTWGIQTYPADHYAVVLWDHGNGWYVSARGGSTKAVCWDDTDGGDCLYMAEVRWAFIYSNQDTGTNPSLIGFDACLMGMVEVAYELMAHASVMVGSEELVPDNGWAYDTVLADLVANPDMTPAELGTAITDRYFESYPDGMTMAAVDLTQIPALASDISTMALTIQNGALTDPRACYDAASQILSRLDSVVIREKHGSAWEGVGGLAIYYPPALVQAISEYTFNSSQFVGHTTWKAFFVDSYTSLDGTWVDTARSETFSVVGDYFHIDLRDYCNQVCAYVPIGLYVDPLDGVTFDKETGTATTPTQQVFGLSNTHSIPLTWTASASEPWVRFSPVSGALSAGEVTSVTVTVGEYANHLAGGTYTADLTFHSSITTNVLTREVTLHVGGRPRNAFYWFPLDSDPGWSRDGTWEFGPPTGASDPPAGHTGANVLGNTLAGDYPGGVVGDALVTEALDCSERQNVKLSFWRWLGVEQAPYDQALLEVSANGSDWTTIYENPGATVEETAWVFCEYDISPVADGQSTVYVRWSLSSDSALFFSGWNIDDIALTCAMGAFSDGQTLGIQSDGHHFAMVWDYSRNASLASSDTTGDTTLPYVLPAIGWTGAYLYDYNAGVYVEGFYTYSEPLN